MVELTFSKCRSKENQSSAVLIRGTPSVRKCLFWLLTGFPFHSETSGNGSEILKALQHCRRGLRLRSRLTRPGFSLLVSLAKPIPPSHSDDSLVSRYSAIVDPSAANRSAGSRGEARADVVGGSARLGSFTAAACPSITAAHSAHVALIGIQ
jgi:hypothetical protein